MKHAMRITTSLALVALIVPLGISAAQARGLQGDQTTTVHNDQAAIVDAQHDDNNLPIRVDAAKKFLSTRIQLIKKHLDHSKTRIENSNLSQQEKDSAVAAITNAQDKLDQYMEQVKAATTLAELQTIRSNLQKDIRTFRAQRFLVVHGMAFNRIQNAIDALTDVANQTQSAIDELDRQGVDTTHLVDLRNQLLNETAAVANHLAEGKAAMNNGKYASASDHILAARAGIVRAQDLVHQIMQELEQLAH